MVALQRKAHRYWVCVLLLVAWALIVWKYGNIAKLSPGWKQEGRWLRSYGPTYRNGADYIGRHLTVSIEIKRITGTIGVELRFVLTNSGNKRLLNDGWAIFFNHLYFTMLLDDYPLFMLEKVDGTLKKLTPVKAFKAVPPGGTMTLKIKSQGKIRKSSIMPRWFAVDGHGQAYLIRSTDDDKLGFVRRVTFSSPPPSIHCPEERYNRYSIMDFKKAPLRVVPLPVESRLTTDQWLDIDSKLWVICFSAFPAEAQTLAGIFRLRVISASTKCPSSNHITFTEKKTHEMHEEGYKIKIGPDKSVKISAISAKGAFYAIQSLLSLAETDGGKLQRKLPLGEIVDWPRFAYRGLQIDVARNFIKSKDLINLIKTISLYKLNQLHLHLTDDDGWRIEIKGLPELTDVGSLRMYSTDQDASLIPALGSGPFPNTSGSGFYTVAQYREILKVAKEHHVRVIPELDFPAHSMAAIVAMRARYKRFMELGDKKKAEEFLLHDFEDTSKAYSPQGYRNSAVSPCLSSTYKFTSHVIKAMMDLHKDVQPLDYIHLGGDEVDTKSWSESPKCSDFRGRLKSTRKLQQSFFEKATDICRKMGLPSVGVWGDALFSEKMIRPIPKSAFGNTNVVTYAWISTAKKKLSLLSNNYTMVLASSSYFYLDHPNEPDPDDYGLEWATSGVDDMKIFNYTVRKDLNLSEGNPPDLLDNIVGLEANIWGELTRNIQQVHHQLFPRLLAFAERAWHEPRWEKERDQESIKRKKWTEFANVVGYKELPRLKERNIFYRVPPPGIKIKDNKLFLAAMYPGFSFKCKSSDPASEWQECKDQQHHAGPDFKTEFVTVDGDRRSRPVWIEPRK